MCRMNVPIGDARGLTGPMPYVVAYERVRVRGCELGGRQQMTTEGSPEGQKRLEDEDHGPRGGTMVLSLMVQMI